jgi:4-amino-4-deoxy-L-arabinose transferase-like glycosyltransferase
VGLRVAFLVLEPSVSLAGDEPSWTALALRGVVNLKRPFSPFKSPILFYPPAYPYLLGAAQYFLGSLRAALWVQALLGGLLVPAVGLAGRRAFSARAGIAAAAAIAFYPELVWFAAHFWSETLFILLLWWGLERLLAADGNPGSGLGAAVAAGLLCGLGALTRETILPFVPAAALWLAWPRVGARAQTGARRAAAFVLAALVVIAPWTWRNWVVFHAFVPVSTFGPLNLWLGNSALPREEIYRQSDAPEGPIAQYALARVKAMEAIRERQPGWIVEKTLSEMPKFWGPGSEALDHLDRGAYGDPPRAARLAAKALIHVPYAATLVFFLLGLRRLAIDRARAMLLLFLAGYNALHVVAFALPRYRLPILPLLLLVAADGFSRRPGPPPPA